MLLILPAGLPAHRRPRVSSNVRPHIKHQWRFALLSQEAVVIALSLFAGCVTSALAQNGPVPAKEIQDTWVGKDLTGTTASGAQAKMRLEPDGKASVSAGNTSDTGTWRISESGYCTTWKRIRAGQERCFTVAIAGAAFKVMNPDGSLSGQFNAIK